MKRSKLVFRLSFALSLLLLATSAVGLAQQAQSTFTPTVGQPGKDVVWVPTPQPVVDKMLELAKITPQDVVMDLGSGDGRTVITAAKRGSRAMGIEYNPDMVELSKRNAATEKVGDRATFVKADLYETDLSQAQVITMFLLPDINLKLRPKILDLKPGTRIVSNTFTMGEWEADQSATITDDCSSWCTALLWIVPAKVEGTWKSAQGELKLTQNFQNLSGSMGATAISNAKMNGDQIAFTVGKTQYTGRVTGNSMSGTFKGATSGNWTATR